MAEIEEAPEEEISEEEITANVQPGKPSPLDPDFLMMLCFALFNDVILDSVADTIGTAIGVGKLVGWLFDGLAFIIIFGWMYLRMKQFKIGGKAGKKLAAMKKETLKKIEKKIIKKIEKKIASRALRKALARSALALIIELIPVAGLFTSWTALVISILL